jgi:hypothetical protein
LIKSDWLPEEAMCGFTVELIDFEKLSEAQKKTLLKNLERKRNSLQRQKEDVDESLKGINRALKVVEKKSR